MIMKKIKFYFLSALTLIFVGLKLADKIDWSWWWVFSPMLILVIRTAIRIVTMLCLYCFDKDYREAIKEYEAGRKQLSQKLTDRLNKIGKARQAKWERKIKSKFNDDDKK